jgi:glycine dehydrogenase subunit 1
VSKAAYALERLTAVPGVEAAFPGRPIFKEFTIRLPRPAAEIRDAMVTRGYLAGVPAPDDPTLLVVAVTERRTRGEIDGLASALEEVLR